MALDDLFLDNTIAKILDHFIAHEGYDYTKNEVSRYTGLSRMTLHRNWHVLEESELIRPTRKIGRAQLYTLNKENEATRKLLDFAKEHAFLMLKKAAGEEEKEPEKRRIEAEETA